MVARHPAAVKRATSYSERLRLGIAVIHGEEKAESERDDGRNSPPPAEVETRGKMSLGLDLLPRESLGCVGTCYGRNHRSSVNVLYKDML